MKTEKNILIAFLLNLSFSIFEFIGGIYSGSIAIISDAVHDMGDSASIGLSFFLEKKSKKQPDETYTYGYIRYSVLGSIITTSILLIGSVIVICHSLNRIIYPIEVKHNEMIIFAVFGVCVNFSAALFTRGGDSINQKAVNLHMMEDMFGWLVVLIGAVIMKFTDFSLVDPILSIVVSTFILINAIKNLKEIIDIFLLKTPHTLTINEIKVHLMEIEKIIDIHHVHIWSMDGLKNYATMHIVTDSDTRKIKEKVRKKLCEIGICHATLELETPDEKCSQKQCMIETETAKAHHHHH